MPGKRRNRPFEVLELDFSGLPTYRELAICFPASNDKRELVSGNCNQKERPQKEEGVNGHGFWPDEVSARRCNRKETVK